MIFALFVFITQYLNQIPGWSISSHSWFGAPKSKEVATLAQKIPGNAPVITVMAGESYAPSKPRPAGPLPTYVPGKEHFGTIRSANMTSVSKSGLPYWPIFREPGDGSKKYSSSWKEAPFAYAYRDDSGKWKVTSVQPIDQTPWYRAW
jgi:hypothetical protein